MDLLDIDIEKTIIASSFIFSKYLVLYRYRAKKIANLLINDDGQLNLENAASLKNQLSNLSENYGLIEQDAYILEILNLLIHDKTFQKKITNFNLPITAEFEKFVALSTGSLETQITKTHLRKAALAAILSYLRQTVGSCFATAPCLYILKRHPDYFLEDLYLLSKKNCLERLSSGNVISVPMAVSIGAHFLETPIKKTFAEDFTIRCFQKEKTIHLTVGKTIKECLGAAFGINLYCQAHDPLLKIWEYTVASLCDAKGEFSESTLYLTLGLDSNMQDGLGVFFHDIFQKTLDQKNTLLLEAQSEAYLAQQRLVMAENMAKNASTQSSLQRSKSEIIAASYQLHSRHLDIEDAKKDQEKIKHLYEKKIHLLKETISQFFQESYDPDLVNMKSFSDDAPAGFRLFVKDGQLTSRFQAIHSEDEFIKALKRFFETIETKMLSGNLDKDNQNIITHVITETIQFSSSKNFLEKTYQRAKNRHPKALPWAYVSGGTLETLLKTYFRKEILKYQKIKGDSVEELFIVLIDYFKSLPEAFLESFRKNSHLGLLLETKHHACQLMPGLGLFRSFWESSAFTYTEIRDKVINIGRDFYSSQNMQKIIPEEFFAMHGNHYPAQPVEEFLRTNINKKESLFIISSFLISAIDKEQRGMLCGYCEIGDTNWTYNTFVIGYNPFTESLCFFAQDPETCGLLILDNMEHFPLEWKIYDDLSRIELFISGIKI